MTDAISYNWENKDSFLCLGNKSFHNQKKANNNSKHKHTNESKIYFQKGYLRLKQQVHIKHVSKTKDEFKIYPCNALIFCTPSDKAGIVDSLPIVYRNFDSSAIISTICPPNHSNP